ncbi:Transcription factor vrtR1 [Lasiodiplodia hormozganensis]|uniref:Transcription factor vrtR1 n=1 Tax=Lasiodiplodia hormozganensis TaxID=869390 RepID=A0AA40CQT5_9PEZI|nr:Transcription factor vrtR1 [Lasiodiplodia hormozganensis]
MLAIWPTPEQESPTTSPPSSQPRKAQRVLACVLCQQRKIKCNRKFPCSNCIRSKASCVPATVNPRRKRRFPERELLDRLNRYEDLLRQNNVKFEPLHKEENASPNVEGANHSDEDMPEAPVVERPSGLVNVKPEPVYEPKNFWHTMSQGFRDPDNDSDSSQDDVREEVVKNAWDLLYSKNDHLLLGSRKTAVDISTLHPEPVQILRLWQIYLDGVNPLLKVTHAPSLQGRIIEATSNVSHTSAALEALMLSIYCVAVQSLDEDDCQAIFNSSKENLLTAHHFGCEQALLNCGFLRTGDRDCLTALFLYLISVGPQTDPRSLSSMLGVALRIAQRMGIDSESANSRCNPLEAEMRRRLWWSLVLFDARVSELANYRSTVLAPTWDCKIPLNVSDSDLWSEMREPPPAQEKCTDVLYAAVRSELGDFLRHAAIHLDFTTPALKPIAKDAKGSLDILERRLNDKYLRFCDPQNPLHFMTLCTTRSFLARYRLVEHNNNNNPSSSSPSSSSSTPSSSPDLALSHALTWLDADTQIMTSPLTKPFRWLFQFYFPFPAYVQAVQHLKRRPLGPDAARAWALLSDHYDARFATAAYPPSATAEDGDANPLYGIFARMVLQAWRPREEALQEAGEVPVVVPRIVERFRVKMAGVARAEAELQQVQQEQEQGGMAAAAAAAEVVDVGGLMGVGFGGYGGMMFGMDGQQGLGGYVEPGLGGFPNAGLLGQFPLDVGMGQMNWAGMDWGFGDGRGG